MEAAATENCASFGQACLHFGTILILNAIMTQNYLRTPRGFAFLLNTLVLLILPSLSTSKHIRESYFNIPPPN